MIRRWQAASRPPMGRLRRVSLLVPEARSDGLRQRRQARLFWRVLDALDYPVTQARLGLADAVCGPEP